MPSGGFIAELVAEHRPTSVKHGFCHPGFGELSSVHIADDDQGVFADNPRRRLVELMFARVGDLGMDRTDAALVPGALLDRERGLVFSIVTESGDGRAVATCGQRLQPEINADLAGSSRQIFGNFALENSIPATARVLREAARFETVERNVARSPEPEFALEIRHLRPVGLYSARDKRQPAERTFGAETDAKPRAALPGIPRGDKLTTSRSYRVGVQPEQHATARAQIDKVISGRPSDVQAAFAASLSLALRCCTEVPDKIARSRMPSKMLARCGVLDAIFVAENHDLFL